MHDPKCRIAARTWLGLTVGEILARQVQRGRRVQALPTVDVMPADVNRDDDLRRLVAGSDVVVNLVARLHGSQSEFDRTHVDLPRRLAESCRQAGVRRIVHVSALGASGPVVIEGSFAGNPYFARLLGAMRPEQTIAISADTSGTPA